MDVKVETKCARCGKKSEKTLQLEAAQALNAAEGRKQTAVNNFLVELKKIYTAEQPEVIVVRRSSDGQVAVMHFDQLCSSPDAKRNRGCTSRVDTLIEEIFKPPKEETQRKPRAPKAPKENKEPKANRGKE
jgi:hypothetical protein